MGSLSFACEGNLLSRSEIQEEAILKPAANRKQQQSQVFVTVDGLVMGRKRKCKPTALAEMALRSSSFWVIFLWKGHMGFAVLAVGAFPHFRITNLTGSEERDFQEES